VPGAAQGLRRRFAISGTIGGGSATKVTKADIEGNFGHRLAACGIEQCGAETFKSHFLQGFAERRLAKMPECLLQRAQADAGRLGDLGHGNMLICVFGDELLGAADDGGGGQGDWRRQNCRAAVLELSQQQDGQPLAQSFHIGDGHRHRAVGRGQHQFDMGLH
jgi:hypothetical protein